MAFIRTNPNPYKDNAGDCTIRAICLATNQDWCKVYLDICLEGLVYGDMPSSNEVWGLYLLKHGFTYKPVMHIPGTEPYTISDFAKEHNKGVYIVATGTHVVCVKNGDYLDTWDSGNKIPIYYFAKEATND